MNTETELFDRSIKKVLKKAGWKGEDKFEVEHDRVEKKEKKTEKKNGKGKKKVEDESDESEESDE